MKFTIELTDAEVKGLRDYLRAVDDSEGKREDIKQHVQGIVTGVINAPQEASSHYIQQYQTS